MNMKTFVIGSALVALTIVAAAPAAAQQTSPTTLAVTDPLSNYTLDVLIPARTPDQAEAAMAVAKKWEANASRYRESAKSMRELAKQRAVTKSAEIKALEARAKEAKKTGDKAERERIQSEIKAQKAQLDALKTINNFAASYDDMSQALKRAGAAWQDFIEAETAVAKRRKKVNKELSGKDLTPLTGQPTAEDFQIHERYIKAFDDYGAALENLGEKYQKVASTVAKTVKELEAHELGK